MSVSAFLMSGALVAGTVALYTRIPSLTKYYMSELKLEITQIMNKMLPMEVIRRCLRFRSCLPRLAQQFHRRFTQEVSLEDHSGLIIGSSEQNFSPVSHRLATAAREFDYASTEFIASSHHFGVGGWIVIMSFRSEAFSLDFCHIKFWRGCFWFFVKRL